MKYIIFNVFRTNYFLDTVTKRSRQMRDLALAESKFDPELVLSLLLHVAQLELKLRELYKKVCL